MNISFSQYTPDTQADCIILPIYQDKQQPLITTEYNNSHNNFITELLDEQDLTGKLGELKWLYNTNSSTIKKILTVGFGKPEKLTNNQYIKTLNSAIAALETRAYNTVINGLADVEYNQEYTSLDTSPKQSLSWKLCQIVKASENYRNKPASFKTENKTGINIENYKIATCNNLPNDSELDTLLKQSIVIAKGLKTAKDLGNCPPNICNPAYFAEQTHKLVDSHANLSCTIYEHEQLDEMGMGAFVSVSQGSNHPGKLIIIKYNGAADKSAQPYVLVGKGITFDTGGYTLKPAQSMLGMKYDMCGAASVFATMQCISELNLPINVIGMLACAENMIGHKSTRPNDIIKSYNGKTIEINNTDAEGRLVLCDTISYAEKYNPKVIIDIATLTGAAVMALGYQYSAFYTNQAKLQQDLLTAANKVHDPIWPMPLCHDYDELLNNPMADLQNSSSMPVAGSITAARFLANFVPENCPWAHFDIAGSATVKSDHKEATGRPVPLLVNYLIGQC